MIMRSLGRGGPEVSVLGLGTWPIGGGMGPVEERTAIAVIREALDRGVTMIDTAEGYRTSEAVIGKALAGGRRERCFLASKVSFDFSARGIQKALENSLRALGTDYLDLYQIHRFDPAFPVEESMETLARLRDQGKTRTIGVSNYKAEQMERALSAAPFSANQVAYNMIDRQIEAGDAPFCRDHGIGIIVHSPLAKGLLAGKYSPDRRFPESDERSGFPRFQGARFAAYLEAAERLRPIARERGLTLVQLAVAWAARLPGVSSVLVGARSLEQLEELLGAGEVELTAEELNGIEEATASVAER